jgi:hypothetical protein
MNIAIVGKTGTGKSTSIGEIPELNIKGLNPKETVLINVAYPKELPFKGNSLYKGKLSEGGNLLESSDAKIIAESIKYISDSRKDIKNIIIDDGQYIMAFEFMQRAKESGYGKFGDIGVNINKVLQASRNVRKDLNVFYLWHPEDDKEYGMKMKTVGTMVDNYLTLEGLFTVILYSRVTRGQDNKPKYEFITNNDGIYPAKSPIGMFKELYILNDLGLVSQKINEYYS